MWTAKQLVLIFVVAVVKILAQSVASFPPPDSMMVDAKHKEPKSGVQVGPGNTISIQSGVGTPTTINVLAFSRDSGFIAAGKDFGRVVVWDVGSRKFLSAVETGQGIVHAVAFSADGQLLATAGEGDQFSLKLWHLPDGKLVRRYALFSGYIHSAAFSPTGSWIVASDNAGVTHVLDSASDKQIAELKGSYSPVLSSQGDILMTVSKDNFIVWATSDWTQKRTLPRTPTYAIPLSLSPETDRFVVTSSGAFRLLRLSTGEILPYVPKPELPTFNGAAGGFAAFGSSGNIFGHSDDRLWVWNIKTSQTCVSDLMYSESGTLTTDGGILAGAKDNSIFAQTKSGDGVWIWDTKRLVVKCFGSAQ